MDDAETGEKGQVQRAEDGNERTDRKGEGCGDHDKPLGRESVYHTVETRIKAICLHRI